MKILLQSAIGITKCDRTPFAVNVNLNLSITFSLKLGEMCNMFFLSNFRLVFSG